MEEDGGVRVPVTRRRMKLSAEQSDEVKSSPAANTPTKKVTRRTAKPDLDLIDENATENMTLKKTGKKTALKEIELVEEKPLTPSRRSARIKSNTSIVSETTQAPDTPRAKRAVRRTSLAGSDSETPLTPARQTRRTRKDSTSKVEQAEQQPAVKQITEMILEEESESTIQKSPHSPRKSMKQSNSPSALRQSPRLSLKNNIVNNTIDTNDEPINSDTNKSKEHNTSNKENEINTEKEVVKMLSPENKTSVKDEINQNSLSESSSELLKNLNTKPKKRVQNLNKSASAMVDSLTFKSKRHRTKSWTTLSTPVLNDNHFFSDSETVKEKRNSFLSNSRDKDLLNTSTNKKLSLSPDKENKNLRDGSVVREETGKDNSSSQKKRPSNDADSLSTAMASFFAVDPGSSMKAMVYIEDSDCNSDKLRTDKNADDDQCVPKVLETHIDRPDTSLQKENQSSFDFMNDKQEKSMCNKTDFKNDSCEPMDVDVTLPDNMNVEPVLNSNSKGPVTECSVDDENKNRNSSLPLSSSQILEKTSNENKSTLVLSEHTINENDVMQSPQIRSENNSKFNCALDMTKENKGQEEKKLSSNYSTSTPLQQKDLKKHALQVTSSITSNQSSKTDKSYKKIGSKASNNSKKSLEESVSDEKSVTEEESEQEQSKFIDDEAEEASDDYESGDSKDEDEERYERENEILHKGETLSTEDEISNDTDYEKDSFLVSSDEEDEVLLDGSGDDLSMSDNELKMTAKSKKKYNEQRMKEQKNASREMFESRHKLNKSNESIKSQSSKVKRKQHRLLDSSDEEDIQIKTKKNNKMRLDSSHETSVKESLDNNSLMQINKSLSKSINNESRINENEIKIPEENVNKEVDSSLIDKKEIVTISISESFGLPQKSKTNNSVKFMATEYLDNSEVDKNISVKSARHDSLVYSNASDSSDSSNNEHIQNFDSILNELNKIRETNTSLNLGKKIKKKAMPIVDQLNLTQTVPKKLKEKQHRDTVGSKTRTHSLNDSTVSKNKSNNINSDNESSNSIDLHLLFSEESNSSENQPGSEKNNDDNDFIPLKESLGKTNILEDSGINKILTTDSAKKKNKNNKSLNKSYNDHKNEDNDNMEVQFFVDTTGTYGSTEIEKEDLKEKEQNSDSDSPTEVSNKSVLEKESQRIDIEAQNKSISKTPKSNKKKKRISESSIIVEQTDNSLNRSVETKTPKNDKKKQKKMSDSQTAEQTNESIIAYKLNTNSNTVDETNLEDIKEHNVDAGSADKSLNKSIAKTPKNDKIKKKRLSESQIEDQTCESDVNNATKVTTNPSMTEEPVLKDSEEQNIDAGALEISVNKSISKTPRSEKKKKKSLSESKTAEPELNDVTTDKDTSMLLSSSEKQKSDTTDKPNSNDAVSNTTIIKTPNSEKKEAKKSEVNTINMGDSVLQSNDNQNSAKKNKKKMSLNKNETSKEKDDIAAILEKETPKSKKRKRQSSLDHNKGDHGDIGSDTTSKTFNESVNTSNVKNKKRKVSHNTGNAETNNEDELIYKETQADAKKQRRNMESTKETQALQNNDNTNKDIMKPDNIGKKKENKKRKEREDDEEHKVAKVPKLNSFDKVSVRRLPTNILNQLEDQPQKKNSGRVTKSKAISTSNFIVEETKVIKTKPSNYLEESVYLNEEDDTSESKKQRRIETPKVLPFLPTVSTSNSGYTTNFKVNIIPKEFKFVARSSNVSNFKNEFLENKKLKRLGTFELYKRSRNVKLSKF